MTRSTSFSQNSKNIHELRDNSSNNPNISTWFPWSYSYNELHVSVAQLVEINVTDVILYCCKFRPWLMHACLFLFTFGLFSIISALLTSISHGRCPCHFCRQFSLSLNWDSITATSPIATPTTATTMPIIVPTDSSITPEQKGTTKISHSVFPWCNEI